MKKSKAEDRAVDIFSRPVVVRFCVSGEPVPKGRPRFSRGHVFTPRKTLDYEKEVMNSFTQETESVWWPTDREYKVRVLVRPRRRGDLDNYLKSVMDGLNGSAYLDDSQVTCAEVSLDREYCRSGARPELWVEVSYRGEE